MKALHGRLGPLPRYVLAATLARSADAGTPIALMVLALVRTGDAAVGGLLVAAVGLPHVLAGPLVGALADRGRAPGVLHGGALLGYACAVAGIGVTLGRAPLGVPFVLGVLAGTAGPLLTGGLTSLLTGMLAPKRRARGYAIDATTYNIGGIGGPAAAAAIAGTVGAGTAMFTLSAAVAVGAGVMLTLPLPIRPDRTTARHPLSGLGQVARTVWSHRALRATTVATTLSHAGIGGVTVAAPLLAERLGQGYAAAGLLMTAFAAGALAGSLAMTRWRPVGPVGPTAVVHISLLATGVLLALASAVPWLPLVVALFAAAGGCDGPLLTATLVVRGEHTPPGLRTQLFATAASLKISAGAAGAALAGVAAGMGKPTLLAFIAASQVASALAGYAAGRMGADRATEAPSSPVTSQR